MERQNRSHIDVLDQLRGIAILCVFVYHCLSAAFGRSQPLWGDWFPLFNVPPAFLAFFPATLGVAGVPIFFVVSGFCIHLSFCRNRDWGDFAIRRLFRIYPPYLLALLLFSLAFPITRLHLDPSGALQLGTHLLLVHNFADPLYYGINPSFWSIAVEFQLYCIYPILLVAVSRIGWKRSIVCLAILEIALRLADGWLFTRDGVGIPRWLSGSPLMFWFSWSIGAFLAEMHLRGRRFSISVPAIAILLVLAVASSFFKPLSSFQFMLYAVLTGGILTRVLGTPGTLVLRSGFVRRHLQSAGKVSYSVYLFHQPFLYILPHVVAKILGFYVLPVWSFFICLASWSLLLPFSTVMYRVCEVPSIALGKRVSGFLAARPIAGKAGSPLADTV